jgi:uncharacterized membrane protein YphA (DoxX/SURF4 family)
MDFSWPAVGAALTIVAQLATGLMVATGFGAWLGSLLLGAFTLAATLLEHHFRFHRGGEFRHDLTTRIEHLGIVGGFLLIAVLDLSPVR